MSRASRLNARGAGSALAALSLLAALMVVASADARPVDAGKGKRPNILVVMTDDMTLADTKFMPKTNRLLGEKGTTFSDAVDSFPLCCPARATFITGQYAHNHGVEGNFAPFGWYGMKNRANTLPAWLQDAGYNTALIGKWLNGYGAIDQHGEVPAGFDTWRGLLDVSAYDYFNYVMNKDGLLKTWGDSDFARKLVEFASIQVDDEPDSLGSILAKLVELFGPAPYSYWGEEQPSDYSPDVTGEITKRLIRRERTERKPFFIWWAPVAPHREDVATTLMGRPGPDPRPPPRHADESAELSLPKPPSFNEMGSGDIPENMDAAVELGQDAIDQLELDYQGRAGSLMAVDDHVAKLVQTLRETNQLKNTVIFFVSDNGWLQGEHRIPGDKYLPYEESLRVPLIVRGPGVPKGKIVRGQVSNIDFAPTLVDFANATAGRTMDGLSLLPTMKDHDRRPDRALGIEALRPLFVGAIPVNSWDRPYNGVRTDRYTYVVYSETGDVQLFDRREDPYQLHNLAGEPGYEAIESRLNRKMRQLESCAGKACNIKP